MRSHVGQRFPSDGSARQHFPGAIFVACARLFGHALEPISIVPRLTQALSVRGDCSLNAAPCSGRCWPGARRPEEVALLLARRLCGGADDELEAAAAATLCFDTDLRLWECLSLMSAHVLPHGAGATGQRVMTVAPATYWARIRRPTSSATRWSWASCGGATPRCCAAAPGVVGDIAVAPRLVPPPHVELPRGAHEAELPRVGVACLARAASVPPPREIPRRPVLRSP